jgi:hypothetical protein
MQQPVPMAMMIRSIFLSVLINFIARYKLEFVGSLSRGHMMFSIEIVHSILLSLFIYLHCRVIITCNLYA